MESIWILKHIYLDKSFLFFLVIVIITGSFNDFILYFSLLVIHELGHTITGICLGYRLDKISFYSYGGVTKFNMMMNVPLRKELLILVMGPIVQIIGYLILKIYVDSNNLMLYHYTLLIFNLLPVYPLDGGRIINLFCNYFYSYIRSFYLSFWVSFVVLIGLFIYNIIHFNLNLLLMIIVLFIKLFNSRKNLTYLYNRFLLERHLYDFSFKKEEYINSINKFYRDRVHVVNLEREKKVLKKYFR